MARGIRARHRLSSRLYRSITPYPLPSCHREILKKKSHHKKCPKILERKDWEDAICSVCMEYPHNAVLLLCSSHDKGCRPYMCATSCRYSNCLDQFKKAYPKSTSLDRVQTPPGSLDNERCGVAELACPLCRGPVKGWTVVEPAREYLNAKKRSCMQDGCSFIGTYKELRKHVRAEHPFSRPREVDPIHEQKWKRLERERERDDVISTIRSSMPGAMVMGDYVIEGNPHGFGMDDLDDEDEGDDVGFGFDTLLMQMLGTAGSSLNARLRRLGRGYRRMLNEDSGRIFAAAEAGGEAPSEEEDDDDDESWIGRRHRRRRRVLGRGRSERRQTRRSQRSVIDLT